MPPGKYLPPHMRNGGAQKGKQGGNQGGQQGGGFQGGNQQGGGFQGGNQQGGGYQGGGHQGGGGQGGGYQNRAPQQSYGPGGGPRPYDKGPGQFEQRFSPQRRSGRGYQDQRGNRGYQGNNYGGRSNNHYGGGGGGYRDNRYGGNRNQPRGNYNQRGNNRRFRQARDASTEPDPELELELFGVQKEQPIGINFDAYDKIPVQVSGNNVPPAVESFKTSELSHRIAENIRLSGYTKPTPVQKHSIPIALQKRDLMSCAQTGSGKTAAFLLPMIHILTSEEAQQPDQNFARRNRVYYPEGIVMSPTRELSQQIHREARKFMYCTGKRAVCVYGGADIRSQFSELDKGVSLLVATPGRLGDFLNRDRISLCIVRFVVLDEADRMLDLGFEPQIQEILDAYDMPMDRQMMMFSATFPTEIQRLAQKYLKDYIFLAVGRVGSTTDSITQRLVQAEGRTQKIDVLMDLLPTCNGLTLVFVATRRDADHIEHFLRMEGVQAESIHGNRTQQERERALRAFRDGDSPILVATDVAARGLDVPNVKFVINYDLPQTIDSYVHRIGRTGRCGNTGTAISFVSSKENRNVIRELNTLLQEAKQEVPHWFNNYVDNASYGGGGGGYRSRRNRDNGAYGGRDIRQSQSRNHSGGFQRNNWRRNNQASSGGNPGDAW